MALDIATTMGVVQTHLEGATDSEGQPLFVEVAIGGPTMAEPDGPSARITAGPMQVVAVTAHPIELHVVNVLLYRARFTDAEEDRETETAHFVSRVADLFYGDFSLGGNVRNIDVAGEHGQPMAVEFTQEDVGDAPFHVATLTLPLVVDSATSLVA